MSDQAQQARPSQVTAAGLIVMLGSVFVILLMWDRIAHLHTADTQDALKAFLDRSRLRDSGFDTRSMTTVVKVVSMVCAALAVAVGVQGWQVSKRSRNARIAVTVLAVPLFLTGLIGDGFVDSAAATFWCAGVGAAALTLWLGPARVWFGDASPTLRSRPAAPQQQPQPPRPSPFGHPPSGPTSAPTSAPPYQQSPPPAPPPSHWAPPATSAYDARPGAARPRALLAACIVTWVCTALAAAGLGISLVMLATDSGAMLDQVYRQNPQLADQGLSRHAVLATLITLCAVVLVAALAAAAFALLLFLRHSWAWYALVVSASAASLMFLIGALGSPVAIVLLVACVATIACLVRPEVRAWVSGR